MAVLGAMMNKNSFANLLETNSTVPPAFETDARRADQSRAFAINLNAIVGITLKVPYSCFSFAVG